MFGYINPLLSNLSETDINIVKKYYCGLCISIKNKFGNIPRLSLSYDATFFALFFNSLVPYEPVSINITCLKHPLSKRNIILSNPSLDYSTDFNILCFYYKLIDDINDDNTLKAKILMQIFKPYIENTTHTSMLNTFETNLSLLNSYEKNPPVKTLDILCHPFSNLIGTIFFSVPFELSEDSKAFRNNLYHLGYLLGKWLYLTDALDDLKMDIKKHKFNPLNYIYNEDNSSYDNLISKVKEPIDFTLMTLATSCNDELKNIPLKRNESIINNTISHGLVNSYMNIFNNL